MQLQYEYGFAEGTKTSKQMENVFSPIPENPHSSPSKHVKGHSFVLTIALQYKQHTHNPHVEAVPFQCHTRTSHATRLHQLDLTDIQQEIKHQKHCKVKTELHVVVSSHPYKKKYVCKMLFLQFGGWNTYKTYLFNHLLTKQFHSWDANFSYRSRNLISNSISYIITTK